MQRRLHAWSFQCFATILAAIPSCRNQTTYRVFLPYNLRSFLSHETIFGELGLQGLSEPKWLGKSHLQMTFIKRETSSARGHEAMSNSEDALICSLKQVCCAQLGRIVSRHRAVFDCSRAQVSPRDVTGIASLCLPPFRCGL